MAKLQPLRKHQSVSHEARTVLLCHSPYLCFICIHTPLTHRHSHILAQPEFVLTRRNLPVRYHPLTTFDFRCCCSKQRHLRFNVFKVCVSCLCVRSHWATEMSHHALFSAQHILTETQSGILHLDDQLLLWRPGRQFGNTISHFKGSLKYSSAWNRS